ncbi:MAG: nucleoside kinase [Bacilli bacterium]|nr:nucleoside kinase [Bacilli bacterium]
MEKVIKVNYQNKEIKEFINETTLLEISESFKKYYNYPILIANVNNDLVELSEKVTGKCKVDFYDRSSLVGRAVYERSACFMLIVATRKVLGETAELYVEHSMDNGIFCRVKGVEFDKPVMRKIEETMRELSKQDLHFSKVSVARIDAINYFKKKHQLDKVRVLKYISNTYVNLYRLDDVYDYFFGEMAYSTGQIDEFKLTFIKDNGFILSLPTIANPECTLDYVHHSMVFNSFLKYTEWGNTVGISDAADLNEIVSKGNYNEVIRLSEAYYESQLTRIADKIYDDRKNIKMVLLAGPSSSGKTTTAKKLCVYLQSKGFKTHTISIDDYFLSREDTPKNEFGEYDFESIRAIDTNLFNKHLTKLLAGEKVLLPEYNFITGKKEFHRNYLQLGENDIIVIEGLHALNDELTMAIDRRNKYKIFISPLTQLNVDHHNRIHTSDTRKLRRIIRDNKYRGYSASATLKMWRNISDGEFKWIYPFQDDTDSIINSALVYELGVLKTYAEPLLFSVEETDDMYPEAIRLINFLRNFLPIPSDEVPKDSVLREFIGGSGF